MDPSLLDYARFHGITSDYTAVELHAYIDDTFKSDPKDDPSLQQAQLECHNRLDTARATLEDNIHEEKLCLSKEGARFLTSLIRDNQAQSLGVNWDDLLPDLRRVDSAKIDPPIFSLENESDVKLSKRLLRYSAHDIELELSNSSQELASAPNTLGSLQVNENSWMDQIKKDKLKCSKESFSLIQGVRSDAGPSGPELPELEDVLGSFLEDIHIESTTPILRPLSADCLPSSPTPLFDEHMLPTPITPAWNGLKSLHQHPTHCGLKCEDIMNKSRYSFELNRENRHDGMGLSEVDGLTHDTPEIDIESSAKTGCSTMDIFNKEKSSVIIAKLEPSSSSANKPDSSDEYGTCNSDARFDSTAFTTTAFKVSLSEYMKDIVEKKAVKLQHTQQCLEGSSRNESPREEPKSLSRHAAATVTKQPQKARAGSCQQHTSEPHEVHETKIPVLQPRRVTLGSLSSFMETRGMGPKKQIPATSPYFVGEASRGPEQQNNFLDTSSREQQQQNLTASKTPPIPTLQVPRYPTQHDGLVLFLSTGLLKTHLRVIQCLEGSDCPPHLIYRDYGNSSSNCQSKQQPKGSSSQHLPTISDHSPDEADIVLSPRAGIILTTSQETMQLFLPGHKYTSTQPNLPQIKAVNSPLRESIYRLSTRYQQLYVFISHRTEQSKLNKSRLSSLRLSANKALFDSLTSLSAFCASLSEYSSITPLIIPSVPASAAAWILALAHKHICQLPPRRPNSLSQYTNAFTPVNPKSQLGTLLGNPAESVWELFLRRMGLNPYAAQVVLAVLTRDGEDVANSSGFHGSSVQQTGIGCLSRFVEMTPECRKAIFGGLLGENILNRVDSLIERDWQCDWALNFDDGIE